MKKISKLKKVIYILRTVILLLTIIFIISCDKETGNNEKIKGVYEITNYYVNGFDSTILYKNDTLTTQIQISVDRYNGIWQMENGNKTTSGSGKWEWSQEYTQITYQYREDSGNPEDLNVLPFIIGSDLLLNLNINQYLNSFSIDKNGNSHYFKLNKQ